MRKLWSRFFSGGAIGFLAALLLAMILALQYMAGLFTVGMARISKEGGLGEHLLDLGRVAPATLNRPALSIADLAFDALWAESQQGQTNTRTNANDATTATAAGELFRSGLDSDLTDPFSHFARQARLHKLVLISDDGRVLYDTLNPERALEHYDFWEIDRDEIGQALRGAPQTSPFYTGPQGRPIKRCYMPIHEDGPEGSGRVRAILCLWAGENILGGMQQLGRRLIQLNLLLTILMGLVGLLIYRLLRRTRRYERQAAEADRLAGLGSLAAGFAHELRNPLGIIRAFTEDLERGLRTSGPAEDALDACRDIIEEVDRMNRLVGQFLSYSRGEAASGIDGATAVLETTRTVLSMLRPSAEKGWTTLTLEHPAATEEAARHWAVRLESGAFKQVLINLTLNAIQASREGGTVTLTLQAGARQIELRVRDQGAGIPEKDRHRIFEPFFSTRPSGSGLGLAISRQIADRAGGALTLAEARPGHGACFVLSLPRLKDVENAECGMRNAETGTTRE